MFQVEWTKNASKQRVDILKFWIKHNKSETYSKKVFAETLVAEKLLKKNPLIGTDTDLDGIRRILVLRNFSMFYIIENQNIKVLAFYDNRQNPDEFLI
jgi:plasmid stabilization system protein ParE